MLLDRRRFDAFGLGEVDDVVLGRRVEIDDLIAYGEVGLLEAIDAFDATMGRKFTTYAWYRIRGSMLDGLGKMAWFNRAAMERGQYETPPAAPPTTPGSAAAAVAPATADFLARLAGGQADDLRRASQDAPAKATARDLYCYFDNDIKVRAPQDALRLMALLDLAWRP